MANPFVVALASVTHYDLTSAAVNPQAYPMSTPRQSGFTLQNRINFDAVTAPTATKQDANLLKLVKIPPRCMVNRVIFAVPPGQTDMAHKYTDVNGSALSGASAGKSTTLNVGYVWFKSATAYAASTVVASSVIQDVDAVCDLAVTKKTGVVTTATELPQTSASHPEYGALNVYDTSASPPDIFPYGGWLVTQLHTGASASNVYAKLTGDLHIIVECAYMPE